MAIPGTVPKTAGGYIEFLADNINLADKLWSHYAWAVSKAYATAYKENQTVLGKVKVKQQQRKASEEAFLSFGLSLLTVGVAGGVAGVIARKFAKKFEGSKVVEDVTKDVVKWSQQQVNTPLVKAVSGALSSDVAGNDVFAPGDTTPEEYTTGLFEGITWNIGFLTKLLFEVKWDPARKTAAVGDKVITLRSGEQLTAEGAKMLTEAVLDTSFMKEMPSLDLDVKTLTRKAKLALWIGWALARDENYWKDVPLMNYRYDAGKGWVPLPVSTAFWEQLDWEPVRQAVVDLGAMYQAVTAQANMSVGGGQFQTQKGLYMWGFMDWASSGDAMAQLFDSSIPKNAKGFEMVKQQQSRRKLTSNGWSGSSPFTPKMTTQ